MIAEIKEPKPVEMMAEVFNLGYALTRPERVTIPKSERARAQGDYDNLTDPHLKEIPK